MTKNIDNPSVGSSSGGGPKEVFLHLFSMVALYVSAGALIALLFQYINLMIPNAASYFGSEAARSGIRWAVAVLTISFSAYIASVWVLRKTYKSQPEAREMRSRKWLVYLTLFVAALIVLGDLVGVLYNFLEGDITARFVLKALSLMMVAGFVFWYYLWEMRGEHSGVTLNVFKGVAVVIGLAIVGGYVVAGSPASQRVERLDAERVNDLQRIQSYVIDYWQAKDELPQNLSQLPDPLRGVEVPTDPETGEAYEYRTTGALSFELCAVFQTENADAYTALKGESYPRPEPPTPAIDLGGSEWGHSADRHCFERTIDPEFFEMR